jgi:hypothetical protein
MPRKQFCVLAAILVFTCAAFAAQERRSVVLEIELPNHATPQLRIQDGGTGTASVPDLGKYGFVPAIKDGTVVVTIFDLGRTPHERLGEVEGAVGGAVVRSGTTPQFGIRVVRVIPD